MKVTITLPDGFDFARADDASDIMTKIYSSAQTKLPLRAEAGKISGAACKKLLLAYRDAKDIMTDILVELEDMDFVTEERGS